MIFILFLYTEESMDCDKALIFLVKVFPLVTHAPEGRAAINEGVHLNPFLVMSLFTNALTRFATLLHIFFAMTYTLITAPYLVSRIIDGRDRAVSFKCTQRNRHRISRGARLPRRRPPGSLRYIWTSESKDSVPFFSRSSKRLITTILQKTRIPWTV